MLVQALSNQLQWGQVPWDTYPNLPVEACDSQWVVLLGRMLEHKQYKGFHLSLFVLQNKINLSFILVCIKYKIHLHLIL